MRVSRLTVTLASLPFVGLAGTHHVRAVCGSSEALIAHAAKQMTDSDTNRSLVQQYWDAFNKGDMAAAAEFFAEDTRNFGRPVGRKGVLAVLNDIKETFPDVRFTPLQSMVEGEWVAVRGTFSGTHRGVGRLPVNGGMLVGVQPSGRRFDVQHIHLLQLHGGKIVEHFATRDDLGMMRQLGLLPATDPDVKR